MAKKPIKITEVVLRDAHQSLIATRMTMDEMRPILPAIDEVGYYSVECWGGATFDACIRFLDEDPWERLRILRKEMPNTKLQMLFRGQNMLGYRHYADDAVEYFVQKSVANGIDILRIFDALNDPRNLQTAIKAAIKEKAHVQGCISYTAQPCAQQRILCQIRQERWKKMGAHSICIKDMAGLLTPYATYELVKALKEEVSIPVDIHSHYTSGLASMSILKGIEAGADIIDTAISPLALGTSHMPTESLGGRPAGHRIRHRAGPEKAERGARALCQTARRNTWPMASSARRCWAWTPTPCCTRCPAACCRTCSSQLKDAGKEDQLDAVLQEIPRVREDSGYPPLVTPTSQIVGTQAVFNVILRRALQDGNQGVQGPGARRLRQNACAYLAGIHKAHSGRRHSPSPAARQTCWSRKLKNCAPRLPNMCSRRKMCSPTPCSRRWRPNSLKSATRN